MFYDDWIKEAETIATTKGHLVLFKEKILPQLTQAKFNNNTTGVLTSEARNKFMEVWGKMEIKEEEDNNMRKEILEAIEPKIGSDPSKPVIEMEEVKKIVGVKRVCWGCISKICWDRQRMSVKVINKKLINRHCPIRKLLLGDPS